MIEVQNVAVALRHLYEPTGASGGGLNLGSVIRMVSSVYDKGKGKIPTGFGFSVLPILMVSAWRPRYSRARLAPGGGTLVGAAKHRGVLPQLHDRA